MGGASSQHTEFERSVVLFSTQEAQNIKNIFTRLCGSHKEGFSEADLNAYCQRYMSTTLAVKLFTFIKTVIHYEPGEQENEFIATGEELLVALAYILKGSPTERSNFLICLSTGTHAGPVKVLQLKELLLQLLNAYSTCFKESAAFSSWKLQDSERCLDAFVKQALHPLVYRDQQQCDVKEDFPMEASYGMDDLERWLSQSPLLIGLLEDIFNICFPISQGDVSGNLLPTKLLPTCDPQCIKWSKMTSLLDLTSLVFLNQNMPPDQRSQWRFLFSTRVHGESFSMLVRHIVNKGPAVLIVEDADGHVFGGYSAESFAYTSHFEGDSRNFLFSVLPIMDIYPATGYNENFVYLNQGQETIPNGLGMGGQFGYFGLWLDYEFGMGHSKAHPKCTTYGSPQLSAQEEFRIKTLEVWGVGPEPGAQDRQGAGKGSILDKDPTAKAMLTLMNRGPMSEGLREEDATAESPEQHSLPPM